MPDISSLRELGQTSIQGLLSIKQPLYIKFPNQKAFQCLCASRFFSCWNIHTFRGFLAGALCCISRVCCHGNRRSTDGSRKSWRRSGKKHRGRWQRRRGSTMKRCVCAYAHKLNICRKYLGATKKLSVSSQQERRILEETLMPLTPRSSGVTTSSRGEASSSSGPQDTIVRSLADWERKQELLERQLVNGWLLSLSCMCSSSSKRFNLEVPWGLWCYDCCLAVCCLVSDWTPQRGSTENVERKQRTNDRTSDISTADDSMKTGRRFVKKISNWKEDIF